MPTPSIRWDPASGRFRRANGQLVSAVLVRAELDRSLLANTRRIKAIGDDLRSGRISLEAWRVAMKAEIKNAHLRSSALAKGGWSQLTPTDFGRVGNRIKSEYGFLEKWVGEIRSGAPLDGRLSSRGALYTQAARTSFHQVQAEEMLKRGATEERNQLHPAEHCLGPGSCLEQADLGWQPIGTLIPVGGRLCSRNCKCAIIYR